jgi:hypothetical protein
MAAEGGTFHEAALVLLNERGWDFVTAPGESMARLDVQGEHGYWLCLLQSRQEQGQLLFYSICPATVAPHRFEAMAELLTRINFRLAVGCFDMDYDSGQVRLRTGAILDQAAPDPDVIEAAVEANVVIMDAYLPALMAAVHSDVTPLEALARVGR